MKKSGTPRIAVVLGSTSDLPYLAGLEELLARFGIAHEVVVASAHRQPEKVAAFARSAEARGCEVVVACAGYAAHLAGVLAALTPLPVIGVPLDSSPLKGMDSLLSMVQMPGGVPVATVTIGKSGVKNAAVLAAQILALKYPAVKKAVTAYRKELAKG
jgi:phosphoribosylaminoimidazole carboxylase PurE protein